MYCFPLSCFQGSGEKDKCFYQQRRRQRELKKIWWGVNKAAAWARRWTVNCNMGVRNRTICKNSLKIFNHQSKQQYIFKADLSNKLKLCLSEDNQIKGFQPWSTVY